MQPAIFIDRDGVIIQNCDQYVRTWQDVEIFPQAIQALASPDLRAYKVVIVTNQSGIGKGLIAPDTAHAINQRLVEIIRAAGGVVDGLYMCPHTDEDACACRKPKPGLLLQAAQDLEIDLANSIMVGDALTDMQAGWAAGVRANILVRTGRGADQEQRASPALRSSFTVVDSLAAALAALEHPPR